MAQIPAEVDQNLFSPIEASEVFDSTIYSDGLLALKFFAKLNYFIFGYFDPTNILFDNKNKYFLGLPKRYFG